MARRIRVKGQTSYFNGMHLVNAVAAKFNISPDEADEFITASYSGRLPPPQLTRARAAVLARDVEGLVELIVDKQMLVYWRITDCFDNIEWPKIDEEYQTFIAEAGVMMRFSHIETASDDLSDLTMRYDAFTREMALLKNQAMNFGRADTRSALKVYFTGEVPGYNDVVAEVMQSMQAFTKGLDSVDSPNPAVRLPGEAELLVRRMKTGDALLLAATHAFNPSGDNNFWTVLLQQFYQFINVPNDDTRAALRRTSNKDMLPLIIDYSKSITRSREPYLLPFRDGGPLANIGLIERQVGVEWEQARYSGTTFRGQSPDFEFLRLPDRLHSDTISKIIVYILTYALNYHCAQGSHTSVPSFKDYYDDTGRAFANPNLYVRWMRLDENQAAENNSRSDDAGHNPPEWGW